MANSVAITNNALVQAGYPQYCAPRAQDVAELASVGSDFCSSFISYVPPTSTSVVVTTPTATTSYFTSVEFSTVVSQSVVTVTTAPANKKRDDGDAPAQRYWVNAYTTELMTGSPTSMAKRAAIPTPTLVAHWPDQKISAACSLVATGTALTTDFSAAPTPVVTKTTVSTSTTTTVSVSTTTVGTESGRFQLHDSAGNFFSYRYNSNTGKYEITTVTTDIVPLVLSPDGVLNAGIPAGVASVTGNDQLIFDGSLADTNKLFCTLQNFATRNGPLTCSLGGFGGQDNIFQICGGKYHIGTAVGADCQQVTLTAYGF